MGATAITILHLQFADNTLVFYEANESHLWNIKIILLTFQVFSRLAVNYSKSSLIVIGKDDVWARDVAAKIECTVVTLPVTYLGIPLGANMKRVSSWQCIMDKIQKRLSSWKQSCLSRAGRLVLIKAVLNSLPIYYLSIFRMPKKVASEVIKIQRRFL